MNISRNIALEIFGLEEGFSETDLAKEYRRLVKIVHPDTGGDEKLFRFIDSCRNTLKNGENVSEEDKGTKQEESKSYESKSYYVDLETLETFYDYLYEYERKYNIEEIKASILIYIKPKYRSKPQKSCAIYTAIPYKNFKELGVVRISEIVKIPEEMKRFRKFSVRVEFLGDTFKFNVSDGSFKVVKRQKYKHVECLTSICELHFKK